MAQNIDIDRIAGKKRRNLQRIVFECIQRQRRNKRMRNRQIIHQNQTKPWWFEYNMVPIKDASQRNIG